MNKPVTTRNGRWLGTQNDLPGHGREPKFIFPTLLLVAIALMLVCVGCGRARQGSDAEAPGTEVENQAYLPAAKSDSAVDFEDMAAAEESAFEAPNPDEGVGPDDSGEKYDRIVDNPFLRVLDRPLSTFSIDVDTASYSKVRQFLMQYSRLPRPDAVRIEELLNYFQYNYQPPATDDPIPFATHIDISQCPWNEQHRLARVAIKGRVIETDQRPASNLVMLIDSSGSMKDANKLPLLKRAMRVFLEQLNENDRIAIVTYASGAGVVLDSTPATEIDEILASLGRLKSGGSTNGGEGIQLAYHVARENFIPNGVNRILLCTDGDFNVGQTSNDQLVRMVEAESKAGIDLTVLGFGMGNLNDSMLEQISGNGNGNYAFIDTMNEARKVLVEQLSGTLVTIAKDVKIQVEFNPAAVVAYRLIGYENRVLADEDFNDDQKDAGEIGAGHTVTALYEIVPTGVSTETILPNVDPLKYQEPSEPSLAAESGELLTLKLRYKLPGEEDSKLIETVAIDSGAKFDQADSEFQFAAAVAGFGMLLRDSQYRGQWTYDAVAEVAQSSVGTDPYGLRQEFVDLVGEARMLDAAQK